MGETAEDAAKEAEEPTIVEGRSCPKCESPLVYKKGRYGKFIGCANYQVQTHRAFRAAERHGVECPQCKKGKLIERKSRYGKLFYSCNTYPDCNYATWNPPIAETCPQCQWPVLTIKTTDVGARRKSLPAERM